MSVHICVCVEKEELFVESTLHEAPFYLNTVMKCWVQTVNNAKAERYRHEPLPFSQVFIEKHVQPRLILPTSLHMSTVVLGPDTHTHKCCLLKAETSIVLGIR